jgi:hypothetical protein
MGNTTIIELNHDFIGDIEYGKDKFVKQILDALKQGSKPGDPIQGGKIIAFFNRNGSDIDRDWEAFKIKYSGSTVPKPIIKPKQPE